MKKIFTLILLALVVLPGLASAQEAINEYGVKIKVNSDSTITVIERIVYDFGSEYRHGIFRNIPYKYKRDSLNYSFRIREVSVVDDAGQEYEFETSSKGSEFEIKIGDPDAYVSGERAYNITYTVSRAINYFETHDELYWNAIGSDWTVPVSDASARVEIPAGSTITKTDCFVGEFGSSQRCQGNTENNVAEFGVFDLQPAEGLTIVIALPKGVVHQPTASEKVLEGVRDNLIFIFPVLGLLALWLVWYRYGRDPESKLPVTAQYEAPDNLTPIEIGYLVNEQTSNAEITAQIILLATKGYLKIERIPKSGWFGSEDYKLIKLKDADLSLDEFDKNLLAVLFADGSEQLLSKLKGKNKFSHKALEIEKIPKRLVEKGYYVGNPNKVRQKYIIVGVVILWLLFAFAGAIFSGAVIASIVVLAAGILGFGYYMPKPTQKGADAKQLIKGLKEYLSVAEKDRLDFHNDPAKDPKIFEKLLPFALALGVSEQWAKKFDGLFQYNPTWYSDPSHAMFNTFAFNSALGNFNSSAATTMTRSGAGSGSSGFGGGGFSGGGGGGGGGGSW